MTEESDTYKNIQSKKHELVDLYYNYVLDNYPNRTLEFKKCRRDMLTIVDAYAACIRDKTDFEIRFCLHKFYENNKLQLKSIDVELDVHARLADDILNLIVNVSDREHFIALKNRFLHELKYGPEMLDMLFIEKMMYNRATQYCFTNKPIDQKTIDIILRNANGITPAICNEFNYRVDVIPDEYKQKVFEAALTPYNDMDNTPDRLTEARKWQFTGFDNTYSRYVKEKFFCINPQVFAPLLLCISFPDDGEDHSLWHKTDRFKIGRDSSVIGAAFCAWHTVNIVTELGLDHAFCAGFDKTYASEHLRLTDSDANSWHPILFICIGYGDEVKSVHEERLAKHANIVNTLEFKNKL
jgi:nitroreductase